MISREKGSGILRLSEVSDFRRSKLFFSGLFTSGSVDGIIAYSHCTGTKPVAVQRMGLTTIGKNRSWNLSLVSNQCE